MKKYIFILMMMLSIVLIASPSDAAVKIRWFTALTGGAAGALDWQDGADLSDGDTAFVISATGFYVYLLDADSGAAESSPEIISPDNNAGNKRWILLPGYFQDVYTAGSSTPNITFKDSDCTDDDVNAKIQINATDTGSGTEDIDWTYSTQIAGNLTTWLSVDADGVVSAAALGWDFSGVSIEITNSADPDVDAAGEISWDSDDYWLRTYDGSVQRAILTTETICRTITEPDQLVAADKLPIWKNTSGATFVIISIYAMADDDDTDFVLDEYDADGASNTNEIDTVTCTDGTGPYTASIVAGINHTDIETGHIIAFDADAADTPDYIMIVITGYYVGDVN